MKIQLIFLVFILLRGTLNAAPMEKVWDNLWNSVVNKDWKSLREDFSNPLKEALSEEKCGEVFTGLEQQMGPVKSFSPPNTPGPGKYFYPVTYEKGIVDFQLTVDGNNRLIGFFVRSHVEPLPTLEKNRASLSLPFKGDWLVFWGGDTIELNHHHNFQNQKYAFDFLRVGDAGKSYRSNGKTNEDYLAFNEEILAPADGVVTDVIDGVRDNIPGAMNPFMALGNAVFLKHSDLEFSILAHFKCHSITVKVGDTVKSGEPLGRCGNSGNSSEPHLHFQLQNTPIFQDGTGIKVFFNQLVKVASESATLMENYSPVKGDIIRAPKKPNKKN